MSKGVEGFVDYPVDDSTESEEEKTMDLESQRSPDDMTSPVSYNTDHDYTSMRLRKRSREPPEHWPPPKRFSLLDDPFQDVPMDDIKIEILSDEEFM